MTQYLGQHSMRIFNSGLRGGIFTVAEQNSRRLSRRYSLPRARTGNNRATIFLLYCQKLQLLVTTETTMMVIMTRRITIQTMIMIFFWNRRKTTVSKTFTHKDMLATIKNVDIYLYLRTTHLQKPQNTYSSHKTSLQWSLYNMDSGTNLILIT